MFDYKFNPKKILLILILSVVFFQQKVISQEEMIKQAQEIRDKYTQAIGGKENLEKIKTIETEYKIWSENAAKTVKRIEDRNTKPIKYYEVTESEITGKFESGFDGKKRWIKSTDASGYADDDKKASSLEQSFIRLPNETIENKEFLVLQLLVTGKIPIVTKLYYDPNTYLLMQREVTIEARGIKNTQITYFDKYQKIGDILTPFSEVLTQNGRVISEKHILSIKYNAEYPADTFEYKASK